jgi:uroporphyrin-III C-methyltransferase/precorrin-2 dehydrogenase/sirohydrochlorin ferrochelatase
MAVSKSRDEQLSCFPVFLKVEGRFAVVVGGGAEALNKARLLKESRIAVRLVAQTPDLALGRFAIENDIELVPSSFTPALIDGASLVFAATGVEEEDEKVVAAARARSIPANAVDRPHLCDFYTPALVNRAPVAVAIGTEGAGPVLSQIIRGRIEAMLPQSTGPLARLARMYRGAVERLLHPGAARRNFWRDFFDGDVAALAAAGQWSQARIAATRKLKRDAGGAQDGFVWLVGAGPGAHDLLTLRAQRLLQQADVILHDGLVPAEVVAMGRRDAQRIAVAKAKGRHTVSQERIGELMIAHARAGRRIVRLKAGDPLVFGRAGEEIEALAQAGIGYEIVPGVTSALAAAAAARLPLTLRGVASSLVFLTGHDRDGNPLPGIEGFDASNATLAIYMGRSAAAACAQRLIEGGLPRSTPVVLVESASTAHERIAAGDLGDLLAFPASERADAPALILVGEALATARQSGLASLEEFVSPQSHHAALAA